MTAKQFFKSSAFKCIAVLTSILLVCGIFLTICNALFYVSEDEKFARKIGVMYNGETVTAEVRDISSKNTDVSDAKIEKVWYITDKNDYLVQASSNGNGGAVTCWITVQMQENKTDVKGIGKVLLYSVKDPAEFKDYIKGSVYDKFSTDYVDGKIFTYGDKTSSEYISTGASRTLTAICNDVNGAVAFIKAFASGSEVTDPYANFQYREKINMNKTSWSVEGAVVSYTVVTKSGDGPDSFTVSIKVDDTGKITEYNITVDGSTSDNWSTNMSPVAKNLTGKTLADIQAHLEDTRDKDAGGTLHTGATESNLLCYHAAAFALANYEACLTTPSKGGN